MLKHFIVAVSRQRRGKGKREMQLGRAPSCNDVGGGGGASRGWGWHNSAWRGGG